MTIVFIVVFYKLMNNIVFKVLTNHSWCTVFILGKYSLVNVSFESGMVFPEGLLS